MSARNYRDLEKPGSYEPLSVDDEDRPQRNRKRRSGITRAVCWASLVLALCMAAVVFAFRDLPPLVKPDAIAFQTPYPVVADPVPPIYTTTHAPAKRPLSDCIKPGNLIDEAVATCHYGQFPQATTQTNGAGLVSAQYMARLKADRPAPHQNRTALASVEQATIWQWDGKRTYFAQWLVEANRIDDSSVCGNYRRGSVEYRECRKGAKVYFRDQCQSWGKRWDQSGGVGSKVAQERFCSAASNFNPIG
ncbi:hypothetical protein M2401_003031 [Pseudomonas sp. JUb42]|jgi:hypothetical protein|uniref:hypothetical protein n=1 Tax=Pseudomonas sp. JUb42 TaxID=2940611 RepID=UPI00216860C4|nr:hypothetical protein [Pseudomonas sp. JUb42]MCS3469293.1 hypothetical protein [Pseudomonas sp. JUb42]